MRAALRWRRLVTKLQKSNKTTVLGALGRWEQLARRLLATKLDQPIKAKERQSSIKAYARWFKLGDRLRRLHDAGYRQKRAMDRWTRLAARLSGAAVENDRTGNWAQAVSSESPVRGGSANPGRKSSIDRWRVLASRLMGSDPGVAVAPRARRGGGGMKRWGILVQQLLKQHPGMGSGEGA